MITRLLEEKIQKFIADNERGDIQKLILKQRDVDGVPMTLVADQIAGRRKAKEKFPEFYRSRKVIFPPSINMEQSSSEFTAKQKLKVLREQIDEPLTNGADLTGGFGVDSFYLSEGLTSFDYIEPNGELLSIAKHNHEQLGRTQLRYHQISAEDFLKNTNSSWDFVYIDPSRRVESKKVISLKESVPDITILKEEIFRRTKHLLVKVSPMFDIKRGLSELKNVKAVYVIAVDNEVKELLFYCERDFSQEPLINAADIRHEQTEEFQFRFSEEANMAIRLGDPMSYLFEPNAAVMKAGGFKSVAKTFNLKKISENTHIYTSENIDERFPGRIFKILKSVSPDKKSLRSEIPDQKVNVITRNYPLGAEQLKSKLGVIDGGDLYYLAFSGKEKKYHLLCQRVK